MKDSTESRSSTAKQSVESRFSQVAADYATSAVHRYGLEFEAILDLAAPTGTEQVLDAGCGPGHTALTLAPHVHEVIALDLSQAMLAQGRRLARSQGITNVSFRTGDVEELPFDDGAFDLIVTRFSAHHWPAPETALSEFRRTLRTDGATPGRLLLADVVSFDDYTTDTHLQSIELLRDPSHIRDHTTGQWVEMFIAEGFQADVRFTWQLRLDFQSWVTRMRTPGDVVETIRKVLLNAPVEVQNNLNIEPDCSFSLPCALLHAVPGR
jgi:ubiquinone/menaquinone biosynthesis C-methylase UbiE